MKHNSTFQKISQSFTIEFDELANEIDHNLLSGESREKALIALLRKYLPKRVEIDGGFVIDANGGTSKQQDVVIYDRTVGTVFEVNSVKYYPCESVIAVGEVKANILSTEKLIEALENIRSVKQLDRSNNGTNQVVTGPGISLTQLIKFDPTLHRDQILGFIFTSATLTKDYLPQALQNFNSNNPRKVWPNLFCDFKRMLISYRTPEGLYPSAMEANSLYYTEDSEIKDLLLLFYCILANFVEEAHVTRPNYFSYGSIAKTIATYHPLHG
jgi:hypothetical protein